MKKFIIVAFTVALLVTACNIAYYRLGIFFDFHPDKEVTTFMTTEKDKIYMEKDGQKQVFEIKGVNMGTAIPGKWATDYAIDKKTYLRWFKDIQDLGANTIRVYTIQNEDFYEAFYEYNQGKKEPLYMLHGVWINDYIINSHRDAYDEDFLGTFLDDCKATVDVVHGKKNLSLGRGLGHGTYRKDVSKWLIGYILGVEWEDSTVAYTDHKYPEKNSYKGKYMYTTSEASPFEAMLCQVGDKIIEYESERYKNQRLVAFSNWTTTDPFEYSEAVTQYFMKCGEVDVENIKTTEKFLSGHFASYHVYPYYPDYLNYSRNKEGFSKTKDGRYNIYLTYLKKLKDHHSLPLVISEYGVSSGRGMAQIDHNTGRNQGKMSEKQQGKAIINCYEDIKSAGCAGSCVFTWQDEWFKRTWNTMANVDLENTPNWSDVQTNEQYFGLLSFDPGKKKSICYVDGDVSEWDEKDVVTDHDGASVSMKYDEKFIYFNIKKDGFNPKKDVLYLPIDVTPKTGTTYCNNYDLSFERESDFLVVLNGKNNSRILVQERYEPLRAMFLRETEYKDPYTNKPDENTPVFKPIKLLLQREILIMNRDKKEKAEVYETGKLAYGNGNPKSKDFNSLADFIYTKDGVELRLPWQLLNFANPSEMMIHDDYYKNYGIEYIEIDKIYVGLGYKDKKNKSNENRRIPMDSFALKGWGEDVKYHERLKESYYMLKDYWKSAEGGKDLAS